MKLKKVLLSCLWILTSALPSAAAGSTAVIHVDGLTCPFCAYGVEKKIREIPGVAGLTIRMRAGEVEVRYEDGAAADPEALRAAVRRAGFTPREIRWMDGAESKPATRPVPPRSDTLAVLAVETGLAGPVGAALTRDETLYLAEADANRILRIDATGETDIVAKDLERPMHLAHYDGRLFVPEFIADRIAVIDAVTGNRLATLGDSTLFDGPAAVVLSPQGRIYVADFYGHRVVVLSETGAMIRTIGRQGHVAGELYYPTDLAFGPDGNLYVADAYNHRIQVFTSDGKYVRAWGKQGARPGEFQIVEGLEVTEGGRVLAADAENGRIQVFNLAGEFQSAWIGVDYPVEVVALPNGDALAVLNHAGATRILRKKALR
jgi:DNA-binding beta-propeller fold protein YncE/copper chaperone CopZ